LFVYVRTPGDVNGDGYDDVIIGAPYLSKYKGAAYVVFGCAAGQSATVIQFTGEAINDQAGWVLVVLLYDIGVVF
jgi:hypothetical protein